MARKDIFKFLPMDGCARHIGATSPAVNDNAIPSFLKEVREDLKKGVNLVPAFCKEDFGGFKSKYQ